MRKRRNSFHTKNSNHTHKLPVSVQEIAVSLQEQTLSKVGVKLSKSCFSHGQIYVACSRVSDSTKLLGLAPKRKTKNVVYRDAL
ncbi:hypothetical protein PR048_001071, partial [Dryococelus australis]